MYADLRRLICRLFKLVSPFRWNNVSCDKKFCPPSTAIGWKKRITNESPGDSKSSNIYRERRCFILMRKKEDVLNPWSMIFKHLFLDVCIVLCTVYTHPYSGSDKEQFSVGSCSVCINGSTIHKNFKLSLQHMRLSLVVKAED